MQESPERERLVAPANDEDSKRRISGLKIGYKLKQAGFVVKGTRLEEASRPGNDTFTDEPASPSARLDTQRSSNLVNKNRVTSHSDGFRGSPELARSLNRTQSFNLW